MSCSRKHSTFHSFISAKGQLATQRTHVGGAPKFSAEGISICVEYFRKLGHTITVFVPHFRSKPSQCDRPELLERLNIQGVLKYTPCTQIHGKAHNSYDDRFVLQYAFVKGGIVVSNDKYNDLKSEYPLNDVIEKRILKFVWADDILMFPTDPLGRDGPTLNDFLRH